MPAGPGNRISLSLSAQERDLLDAIVYVQSKVSGATQSPNDVLHPLVSQYLQQHENDPGVQLSIQAAQEARQAPEGVTTLRGRRDRKKAADGEP